MKDLQKLTSAQLDHFQREGYVILENWITEDRVDELRSVINEEVERIHGVMDREGKDVMGISHRNSRYFIPHSHVKHKAAYEHTFGSEMETLCRQLLGDEAQLFLDQLLVKAPLQDGKPGLKFGWHQDAGYISHSRPKYLTCWTALDDMSEENGTVRILPFSRMEEVIPVDHVQEEGTNDMIGYHGDDPGIAATVPKGSIVAFSSYTFHCSGPNQTNQPRRAYLTQYSSSPIMNSDGTGYHIRAIPFIEGGLRVIEDFQVAV